MKTYSIYSIRNKLNGKRYIGLSYKPLKRMEQHRKSIYPIGKAIRKYGWDNFDKRILKTGLTLKQAQKAERFYIAKYKSLGRGYNLCAGGEGVFNPSKELRKRIVSTRRGNGNYNVSEETKKKMSLSAKGNKSRLGTKQSKQAKENMRRANNTPKNKKIRKEANRKAIKTKIKNGYIKPYETRTCACGCQQKFEAKPKSKRMFFSKSCVIRTGQGTGLKRTFSDAHRKRLSKSKQGRNNPQYKHGRRCI